MYAKAILLLTIVFTSRFTATAAQQPQPARTAGIEGIVKRAGTDEPIPGVKVTLIFIPPPAPPPPRGEGGGVGMIADRFSAPGLPPTITSSAPAAAASTGTVPPSSIPPSLTDAKGVFAFRNLVAGAYRLTVAANGYVPQEYGRMNTLTFTPAGTGSINLTAGQAMTGLAFKLTPTGNVSGRVFDLSGQPLIGVPVNLYRPTYNPTGERNPTTVATVRTNDRGEYRIFWIAPGRYYLAAGGNAAVGRPINSINNDVLDNFSYAFYPHGSDIDEASSIDIRPGSELSGHDFRIAPQSFYSISGRLVDSRTGQPPANGNVSVAGKSPLGTRTFGGRTFYDPATGAFEIRDLVPGTYNVTSALNERDASNPQAPNVFGLMAASSIVQVVNADVGDIVLNIVQNQAVSGQVHSDVPIPAGARLQVRLVPATPALGMQFAGAQVNPDGSFRFEATSFRSGPGEYRVSMNPSVGTSGMPASWYLKEAKLDDTEAMNNPVRLPAQATLNLFVSSRGGQVGGVLRNAQGQPVPRMYAVLIPEGWSRQDQIRQVLTDPTGRFSFPNLAPGNYKLFAWEDVESGSWFDPEWVKDWEEKGTTVRLAEGGKEEIDLKTIPPGDPQ